MSAKIDHIGIAVRSLDRRLEFWRDALGLEVGGTERVESERVEVAFLNAGEARIELLEPTHEDSAIARFLERKGEGINHLTLCVDDIDAALGRLRERGVEIVGDAPRPGAGGSRVAFLHPRSCGGVLLELVERGGAEGGISPGSVEPGSCVLAYLHDPQEKIFGVLRRLDGAGVVIEGVDLGSFDDWVAQIERSEEPAVGPSVLFVPMSRVEKLLLDRPSGDLPSLSDRFRQRTGRTIQEVLGA
jgi:methylmalonyl-CoA/ethylmalonyl-CoA epimerase